MNLEMLFWASEQTGNPKYREIAIAHADKTLKNHFREDMTSYHVVSYLPEDGTVESKGTYQGYDDESSWARGQAWAVYGYTMCYRFTKQQTYLKAAYKIAEFIMSHCPSEKDFIPYWDYNAPGIPDESRDVSAATVTASALYELSMYDETNRTGYVDRADRILENLTNRYRASVGKDCGFLLLHSTGSKTHGSEVDVPIVYADYYYLEALLRKAKLEKEGTALL